MFYYLSGTLALTGDGFAVIDCGGVGYRLTVSATTLASLPADAAPAPKVKLYTYLSVREDAVELFGFYSYEELETYKLLISISGVGPKAAMSVLSLMPPSALAAAVREQNVKLISRAQGIGTKTAQRIVLEMSGKLSDKMLNGSASAASAGVVTSAVKEAEDALVVLGYTRSEAEAAVGNVPDAGKKTTEELIRSALSRLI